jgi:hypothetical protein
MRGVGARNAKASAHSRRVRFSQLQVYSSLPHFFESFDEAFGERMAFFRERLCFLAFCLVFEMEQFVVVLFDSGITTAEVTQEFLSAVTTVS